MTLICCPCPPRSGENPPCDKPALWYVWYGGCGGVYTYHCNEHLAESLLDNTVQIVQIDSIARVQQNNELYMQELVRISRERERAR